MLPHPCRVLYARSLVPLRLPNDRAEERTVSRDGTFRLSMRGLTTYSNLPPRSHALSHGDPVRDISRAIDLRSAQTASFE